MTPIFGPVATMYDDVRPGYPVEVLAAVVEFHGGVPASIAEPGAGTGKGTELLVRLGAPVTCIEPDAQMAAVLAAKFLSEDDVQLGIEKPYVRLVGKGNRERQIPLLDQPAVEVSEYIRFARSRLVGERDETAL